MTKPQSSEASPPWVKLGDLKAELAEIGPEMERVALDTLRSGWFILGKRLEEFERRFGELLARDGKPARVVGCGSGTSAIGLALRALDIGAGKTVLTVPNTCAPTAAGIRLAGATLRFADVDPRHWLMDPEAVAHELEQGGIDAVAPVHLYGNVAPVKRIAQLCGQHGVPMIEDCAQAHGASADGQAAGTFGEAAAFSFYPSKNLGAYGDAGAVAAFSPETEERLRRLRNYGYGDERRDWALEEGINSRLDEFQAAFLTAKMAYLETWNARRRGIAEQYDEALEGREDIRPVSPPPGSVSARHLYVVRCSNREAVRDHLERRAIQNGVHYPHPIHLQPAYRGLGFGPGSFPVAERAAKQALTLPLHPFLTEAEVGRVIQSLRDCPPAP